MQLSASTSTLKHKILLVNGANLQLLGQREPDIYGHTTLSDIESRLRNKASKHGVDILAVQSNHEGELLDAIAKHGVKRIYSHDTNTDEMTDLVDAIIINPAAFTHTSVALRDCLLATALPFIEVHLSNVHAREPFRTHSYFSDVAVGVICGLGHQGYDMALDYFLNTLYMSSDHVNKL